MVNFKLELRVDHSCAHLKLNDFSYSYEYKLAEHCTLHLSVDDADAVFIKATGKNSKVIALSDAPVELSSHDEKLLASVCTVSQLHNWQNDVPGIWTVLLIVDNSLYIRTDLMKSSVVYRCVESECIAYSNNPSKLRPEKRKLSLERMAFSLLYPGPPFVDDSSTFDDSLSQLQSGCVYRLSIAGSELIRDAALPCYSKEFDLELSKISSAVSQSVDQTSGSTLAADLSGGFDSTTLCFLIEASGRSFLTFSGVGLNAAAQDDLWASKALEYLQHATPIFWQRNAMPKCFSYDTYSSQLPFSAVAQSAKIRWAAQFAASKGVDVLIGGHGGDELFDIDENTLFHTKWTNPILTMQNALAYSANLRWPRRSILRSILFPQSLRNTVSDIADSILDAPNTLSSEPNIWGLNKVYTPAWSTSYANYLISKQFRKTAELDIRPPTWSDKLHMIVSGSASTTRHLRWIYEEEGVKLRTPYLDESVFRAVCDINPTRFASPNSYKKLLSTSFSNLVPNYIYQRRNKDVGLPDVYQGWEENKAQLGAQVEDWNLVKHGLVDTRTAFEHFSRIKGFRTEPIALWRTLAVEKALQGWISANN